MPHGFRYGLRLLDVDFVPRGVLYMPCVLCGIHLWVALIQWAICAVAMDVRHPQYHRGEHPYVSTPNTVCPYPDRHVMCVITVPPFRAEELLDARGAYLQLGMMDDVRAALRMLVDRWTWKRDAAGGIDSSVGCASKLAVSVGV